MPPFTRPKSTPAATRGEARISPASWFDTVISGLNTVELPLVGGLGDAVASVLPTDVDAVMGVASPLMAAGKKVAGKVAGQSLGEIQGIKAYHGSPHDFDQFSLEHIGTGEGAQAYGHGLYFAEKEGVARSYKASGGVPPEVDAINKRLTELAKIMDAEESAPGRMRNYKSDVGRRASAEYDALQDRRAELAKGRMYEVNIKAHPDELLDWDKPLSEQSETVRTAIKSMAGKFRKEYEVVNSAGHGWGFADKKTGYLDTDVSPFKTQAEAESFLNNPDAADFYEHLAGGRLGTGRGAPEASAQLKQRGVKGIQYLDQGSRAAGEGSRNYVIFDDQLIEIAKKYGVPLAVVQQAYQQWQADRQPTDGRTLGSMRQR